MPYSVADARYYLTVGAALCSCGVALMLSGRAGLALYALICAAALVWTLARFGLDLRQLPPHLLALLLRGGILFALRDRIARVQPVAPLVRSGPRASPLRG